MLLGRLEGSEAGCLIFADDVAENLRFGDDASTKVKRHVDDYIARQGLDAPAAVPDPAETVVPASPTRRSALSIPSSAASRRCSGATASTATLAGCACRSATRGADQCMRMGSPSVPGSTLPASTSCPRASPAPCWRSPRRGNVLSSISWRVAERDRVSGRAFRQPRSSRVGLGRRVPRAETLFSSRTRSSSRLRPSDRQTNSTILCGVGANGVTRTPA